MFFAEAPSIVLMLFSLVFCSAPYVTSPIKPSIAITIDTTVDETIIFDVLFTWAVRDELPDKAGVVINITPLEAGCELTLTQEMSSYWVGFVDSSEAARTKTLNAPDTIL
jgi:hypothetical protein